MRIAVLALLWGSGFLWIKLALTGLSPVHLTLIRCALGALTLLVLAVAAGQRLPRDRRTWGRLVVAAFFCNALPFALFGIGERTVDSGVAGVMNATTPLWSLLIGVLLGTDRRLGPVRLLGLGLGFAGVLVIFAPWEQSGLLSTGALALLGAGLSYAIAFAYMARKLPPGGAPLAVSAAQLTTATALTALALPVSTTAPHLNLTAIVAVTILGVFGTGITFYLNYRVLTDEGPTAAATVGYLLPVVSIALGALFLGEPLSPRVLGGMVVVLIAVGLTRRPAQTKASSPGALATPK
ncbi:Permease of the drug/metabolite transporter (DMT) superfamily [Amycolatopsis pretoriensis]|uniref:Permease of the drug/metabolite transporter (DMT) superfamily n=1 Tax=Amycolatopsis pretoriensis TaxID=218821 RepID=A0A1H5QNC6_9PSEU|nr:DMT family transporter [Amycolatopsis pretoriensis]SEF27555.1 Permease of the drug/metabolite transporter (DMT) superfamily [Amycolatopsis pretoriensis]